jgi:dihydroflavonol-4-reductase
VSKYLVTGATGFLGGHLSRVLRAHGHEVVAFSRGRHVPAPVSLASASGPAGGAWSTPNGGGDVLDPESVYAAAAGCEGAFHCAGRVSRKLADADDLYQVHVEGTKNVLDACARAGVPRVVVVSTSGTVAVSETSEHVATEDDPPPIGILSRWPYYRAKLFAERAALERNRPGFEVVCVNPSLLLGPGDVHGSSTQDVRLLLEGAIPMVPAGGLSFVDARDAAEAMRLAMERGRGGQRYLVGACNLTVRDFFSRLARVSGVRAPWVPMPRSRELARAGALLMQRAASRLGLTAPLDPVSVEMAQCFWYLDSGKAERELGWRARDPNKTLYETVEDLRARGVVWPRGDER